MLLKYVNEINALAPPPNLYIILHKVDCWQIWCWTTTPLMQLWPKIQDIGAKNAPEFLSHIYVRGYKYIHTYIQYIYMDICFGDLFCRGNYSSFMRKKSGVHERRFIPTRSVDMWLLLLSLFSSAPSHRSTQCFFHKTPLVVCYFDCALMMSHWQFLRKQRAALEEKWHILMRGFDYELWDVWFTLITSSQSHYLSLSLWECLSYMHCLCSAIEMEQNGCFIFIFAFFLCWTKVRQSQKS